MATNIFELIIKGSEGSASQTLTQDISPVNGNFFNWLYSDSLSYSVPLDWQFTPALQGIPTLVYDTYLSLYNEDFTENFDDIHVPAIYTSLYDVNDSFFVAQGWIFNMYTLANDGLDAADTNEIEYDQTPGFAYYKPNTHYVIPDLTVYGRISSVNNSPERVGSNFKTRYIPDTSSVHPTSISNKMSEIYLSSLHVAGSFALRHSQRINYGSIRSQNLHLSDSKQAISLTSSAGVENRYIRYYDVFYSYLMFLSFGFYGDANILFYQYFSENFNLLLTKKKFSDIPSSNFPSLGYGDVTCDYPLPPIVLSFENIFQPHTIGKNVELYIKISVPAATGISQELIGCYGDGAVDGSGFYDDIQSTSVLYSIDSSSNLTGTADGKWFPKSFTFNEAFDQNNVNAPVRAEVATSQKMLFFGGQFSNAPFSVARVEKTLTKSTTYNISFNVETCNHGATARVYAIDSSNEIVEALTDEINIPINSATDAEAITHFTFNTHRAFARVALEVTLLQDLPEMSYIRINYVRFELTRFNIKEKNVDYIRNATTGVDEHQVSTNDFNWALESNNGIASEAPIVVTTSELTKYPLSYTRHISSSPYYEEVRYFDDGFAPDSDIKSDVENVILPFNKADGSFSSSESQLNSAETHKFSLLNNSSVIDSDGCYFESFATVRFNLSVGSKDLHIFTDKNFGDMFVDSHGILIKEINFFDSENSFITQNGASDNKIRFKYDPANGVAPPNAVQQEEIPESQIGYSFLIEYKVDSLSGGDSLRIDFGEGTPSLEISSAGTSSGTIIAQGSQLRIRPETAIEKGSALTGLDAVIDYVKLKSAQAGTTIITEQVGSPSSINATENYVAAYDSALRIKNINIQDNSLATGVASQSISAYILSTDFEGANQVIMTIDTMYLSSGSTIAIAEDFEGDLITTTISSTSTSSNIHTITKNNIPAVGEAANALIFITVTQPSSSGTLDVYINNISVQAIFTESGEQGKSDINLDLFEDFEVALNASIKDYRDLESSSSSFSKTLTIPATAKNKLAFNFENELQALSSKYSITNSFNEIKPLKFLLKADGIEVFSGIANLLGSSLDENGAYELEANLVSGNADWVESLREIELKTLSSNNYKISSDRIIERTLNPSLNDEIFFPLVDNGKWKVRDSRNPDAVNVGWGNIKAAFSIRIVLEKIFEQIGYSLVSNFFNENNEYSDEFSPDFGSFKDKLLGIAPSMSKPDFVIQKTLLNISFDPNLESGAANGVSQFSAFKGSESQPRPRVKNGAYLGWDLTVENERAYYLDWAFMKFNVINQDKGAFLSTESISSTDTLGGTDFINNTTPDSNRYKLRGNNLSQTKSVIQVSSSDYYNLDISINFTLSRIAGTDSFHASDALAGEDGMETFMTVILVDSEFANDNLYKNGGFAFNAFDLFDDNAVELLNTDYENTRVSLNRKQYLESNKKYNVVVLMGTRGLGFIIGDEELVFNCGFSVNELDLNLEVSKEVAPMEGKYFTVYNDEATPKVSYLEVLPDVKAVEFISDLTKIFNLNWATNNLTKEITVEPFSEFYDFEGSRFPFKDFTEKALITKVSNNEIINTDLVYAMKDDSSDYSIKESYQGDSSISFGDKKIYLALNGLSSPASLSSENQGVSLNIFSALKMGNAKFITRTNSGNPLMSSVAPQTQDLKTRTIWIPRIWGEPNSTLEPMLPEEKPNSNNSHEYKLCLLKGTKYTDKSLNYINSTLSFNNSISDEVPCVHYSLEAKFIHENEGIYSSSAGSGLFRYEEKTHPAYLEVGSYFPFEPDTPSAIFSDINGASSNESALFNEYHQKLIDMLMMRDKIITAEIYLTSEEIRSLNFRQLVKIDNELYIINKVKDFNFSGEPTEVELLLVTRTGTNHEIL